jgi:hypothetical protein
MSDSEITPGPPRTLTGLGPPARQGGGVLQASERSPETIRPWAMPDGSGDGSDDALEDTVATRLKWRARVPSGRSLRSALAVAALVGSVGLGVVLGRGPLSAPATVDPPSPATSRVVGNAACAPSSAQPSTAGSGVSSSAPFDDEAEALAGPDGSSSGVDDRSARAEVLESSGARRHRKHPMLPSVAIARAVVPDEARVRAVADAVRLDDESSRAAAAAPDAGTRSAF